MDGYKDARIEALEAQIRERNDHIETLEAQTKDAAERLESLEAQLKARDEHVDAQREHPVAPVEDQPDVVPPDDPAANRDPNERPKP